MFRMGLSSSNAVFQLLSSRFRPNSANALKLMRHVKRNSFYSFEELMVLWLPSSMRGTLGEVMLQLNMRTHHLHIL